MRKPFVSLISNEHFQLGCTGQTVYVLNAAGNELAKFKDMIYAYSAALHPNGEVAAVYSNHGMFHRAEKSVIGYTLYATVQSQDGEFAAFGGRGRFASGLTLRIDVDADFNILGMRESDRQVGYADRIGTVDGQPVMWYSREQPGLSLLRNFDAGTPRLVLDEGETVLVISRNITGVYENTPPYISKGQCRSSD